MTFLIIQMSVIFGKEGAVARWTQYYFLHCDAIRSYCKSEASLRESLPFDGNIDTLVSYNPKYPARFDYYYRCY